MINFNGWHRVPWRGGDNKNMIVGSSPLQTVFVQLKVSMSSLQTAAKACSNKTELTDKICILSSNSSKGLLQQNL